MKKEEFYFDSRDGKSQIHAVRYTPDQGEIRGVFQIVHGMSEHIERYEKVAAYMTERGFVVTGDDHLGHGKTVTGGATFGYFCEQDPATVVVRDVHRLKKMTQQLYPGKPYVILGHSMGSFILRNYLCKYSKGIDAAIIMGTGMQPLSLIMVSKALALMTEVICGPKHVAHFLNQIAFGSYNKRFPEKGRNSWHTRDMEEVKAFEEDPLCDFIFTVNGFRTLLELIKRLHKPVNVAKIVPGLPILLVSGQEDPVGNYGEGPKLTEESLISAGVKDVTLKLYPQARHELFFELNREQVEEDIYQWVIEKIC